jgi:hypothetical protein
MYKHWRYRPANPDRAYPFYANFYRPFEDLLQQDEALEPKTKSRPADKA